MQIVRMILLNYLYILVKKFSRRHFEIVFFFHIFPSGVPCKITPRHAFSKRDNLHEMPKYFLGKIRKVSSICRLLHKLAQKEANVKSKFFNRNVD